MLAEAEQLWREILAARRGSLSPNDPRLAEALGGLGGILLSQQVGRPYRPTDALPLIGEAIKIFNDNEETRDIGIATGRYQRAVVLLRLGRTELAFETLDDASNLMRSALGDRHTITMFVTAAHALYLAKAGQHEKARLKLESLFNIFEEQGISVLALSDEFEIVNQFTALLEETGEQEKLEQILRNVLSRQKEQTGCRSDYGVAVLAQLVQILKSQDKQSEAAALVDDFMTLSNVMNDPLDPYDVLRWDALAGALRSLGRRAPWDARPMRCGCGKNAWRRYARRLVTVNSISPASSS